MRWLITGGGTGGHINPAIAMAQYVQAHDPDPVILYAGTPDGMEARLVKKAGFDFAPIKVMGISRSLHPKDMMHNVQAVMALLKSRPRARQIIREFKPDVVLGTGGYVSEPVVAAAAKLGVKTAIHEQNAFPGVTNRLLAKKVDLVFLAVEEAKARLESNAPFLVVGNPVRESVIYGSKQEAKEKLNLNDGLPVVLSYGGSLGADTLNRIGADLISWNASVQKFHHIHGYGQLGRDKFPALLQERGLSMDNLPLTQAKEYIDQMDLYMAAADLVICRSGAITISEIEATGKPAILVPSPNVTANHQYHNAMVLVKKEAALILEEKDYTKERLISMVESLLDDPTKRQTLSQNASALAILDTAKRMYDGVLSLF